MKLIFIKCFFKFNKLIIKTSIIINIFKRESSSKIFCDDIKIIFYKEQVVIRKKNEKINII